MTHRVYISRTLEAEEMGWEYADGPLPTDLENATFTELFDLLEDHISNDEVEFECEAFVEVEFPNGEFEGTYISHTVTESPEKIKEYLHSHYNTAIEDLNELRSKHNAAVHKHIEDIQRASDALSYLTEVAADGAYDARIDTARKFLKQITEGDKDV